MDRVRAARRRGLEDRARVEIAVGTSRGADGHRPVGRFDMRGPGIRLRVDRHGLDAHLARRADDAQRDLAAVGDQDALEHQRGMLPCLRGGRASCLVFKSSSERIKSGRVACASITSSMKPRAAAL